VEADLGQTALQRHLAAFEAGALDAGAGLLALAAVAGSLAIARANAAALAGAGPVGAGNRVSFMKIHFVYPLLLRLCDAEHDAGLGDLALSRGIVWLCVGVSRLLQAQGLGGCDLLLAAADQALLQLDLEHLICHGVLPPQPRISFTVLPRFSATDSALTRPHRPAKVADTTLMGLLERIDLAR